MYDDSGEYTLAMANMRGRWLICCWLQNQSRLKFPDFGGDQRSAIYDQQARSAGKINIDTSPEYSPITEPISFSSSIENYLPSQSSNPIQNQIDEAPLTLPIEYLSAARE